MAELQTLFIITILYLLNYFQYIDDNIIMSQEEVRRIQRPYGIPLFSSGPSSRAGPSSAGSGRHGLATLGTGTTSNISGMSLFVMDGLGNRLSPNKYYWLGTS